MYTEMSTPAAEQNIPSAHSVETDYDALWRAARDRNAQYDGLFILAVKTTGIYCRPSCPARTPKRENVEFYADTQSARSHGYRACLRCKPDDVQNTTQLDDAIKKACAFVLDAEYDNPSVDDMAAAAGVSARKLRRLFQDRLDVSPKAFASAAQATRFRAELRTGEGVAGATYAAGYGSSSRVYENADKKLGMTPAQYARSGAGQTIGFQIIDSSIGLLLVAATERGLCRVAIGDDREALAAQLKQEFAKAVEIRETGVDVGPWAHALADYVNGAPWPDDLPLDIRATTFQAKVWTALRQIPAGATANYGEIAAAIGAPRAARAVGTACAKNPVALAIPCHRVTPATGGVGQYAWGSKTKEALLKLERKQTNKVR